MQGLNQILPGHFFMIKIDESFGFRHPFSVHRYSGEQIEFLVEERGAFSASLARLEKGKTADLTGPLGNGFNPERGQKILAVGGGIGCAPLAVFESCGLNARYLVGAKNSMSVPGYNLPSGKTLVVTEDGSQGEKGLVTDHFCKYRNSEEIVFACGPPAMLKKLAGICREKKIESCFCLEAYMVCGIGACAGCVSPLLKERKKVCAEGPVFRLEDLN